MAELKSMNKQKRNSTASEQNKDIQTEPVGRSARVEFRGITVKNGLDCLSAFLLPCLLGVFTVVITLQQTKLAQQQRLEDQLAAREQREQDLNISKAQRAEDALRRLQDLNATHMQRLVDIHNAEAKLKHDAHLAELQRKLSEEQRAHELLIDAKRYEQEQSHRRHGLLTVYMNEIEILIDKYNGTVTSDARIAALVRGKTLALIRELDTVRKAHLIRFLHEAGQLTNGQRPLNLADAELDDIDLNVASSIRAMHGLALPNTYLRNASFVRRHLTNGNFSGAYLIGAHFHNSVADQVDFSGAILDNTSFTDAFLVNASFVDSKGYGVKFDRANATDANFSRVNLEASSFVQSMLDGANFVQANLSACNLSLTTLNGTLFMHALSRRTDFSSAIGAGVQFSGTILSKTNFQHAYLRTGQFVRIEAVEVNFAFSNMHDANFTNARCHNCNFSNSLLIFSTFANASMAYSTFTNATLSMARLHYVRAEHCDFSNAIANYSNFSYCNCFSTKFFRANLTGADFQRIYAFAANLSRSETRFTIFTQSYLKRVSFAYANVEKAIFTHAYLHSANLEYSNINSEQLQQANAITDAKLPLPWNSTVTREHNLIKNGQANCIVPVSKDWNVSKGAVILGHHNPTNCYFALANNHSSATMSQSIDVKRYILDVHYTLTDKDRHRIILHANVGGRTDVSVVGQPNNVLLVWPDKDKPAKNSTRIYAWYPTDTKHIQVIVEFDSMNGSAWCDDIDLWIEVPSGSWYWTT